MKPASNNSQRMAFATQLETYPNIRIDAAKADTPVEPNTSWPQATDVSESPVEPGMMQSKRSRLTPHTSSPPSSILEGCKMVCRHCSIIDSVGTERVWYPALSKVQA